jgi:2-amino-4-hydroxy-6-hydroxymethyldihydropteridine diphosphokinase
MMPKKVWIDAFIGLGSNLDNPVGQINLARQTIASVSGVRERAFSALYYSRPVGPQDQPEYVNAVMQIETCLSAQALLTQLQQIENAQGRVRLLRWGARTLDLDILLYDAQQINDENLIIPHPEMPNRAFVLYPLADISGLDLLIPGKGRLADLLNVCPDGGLRRVEL